MTTGAEPVAVGVEAQLIVDEILKLGVTHIVVIPDTYQRTLIAKLAELDSPKLVRVCTEDEAMGVNAGLYMGGQRPMMLIQNNGIFASINTMKAIALDAKVPTFIMVGQFLRDVTKKVEENRARAVRLLEPTLDTWGVPHYRLEGPDDLGVFREAYDRAQADLGPACVIVGAPTI
jgi:sulfopyruvate decarboxylase TPP-binding subunit